MLKVGWVQDVLIFYSNFKFKLQVSKLMTELRRKFGKESRARLTISSLGKVLGKGLKGSINVESVNIGGLRRNLNKEFEGVMDAVIDLKFATNNAKVSLKDELVAIEVNIGDNFEDHYIELNNRLTNMYKLQRNTWRTQNLTVSLIDWKFIQGSRGRVR